MKNSIVKEIFWCGLAVLAFTIIGFAQADKTGNTKAANTGEVPKGAKLVFSLTGSPMLKDVGFDYRKSYWKLKYELRLLDSEEYSVLSGKIRKKYKKRYGNGRRYARKLNKKLYKKIRKLGVRVIKGKFKLKPLSVKSNRNIEFPIAFTSAVRAILARSIEPDENPKFVLRIFAKIYGKTASKKKIRKKIRIFFSYPIKRRIKNELFIIDYELFGASLDIFKDGKTIGHLIYAN